MNKVSALSLLSNAAMVWNSVRIAEIGLTAGARALRNAVARLPRP